jgi:hypothetical protein
MARHVFKLRKKHIMIDTEQAETQMLATSMALLVDGFISCRLKSGGGHWGVQK